MTGTPDKLSDCIDKIEAAYEYMLAYAAQGRDSEPAGSSPSIRDFVTQMQTALVLLENAVKTEVIRLAPGAEASTALVTMAAQTGADAAKARQVLAVALTAPTLSSQLIDNVNASAHLRCVLTDIFVLDEALQQHGRAGK